MKKLALVLAAWLLGWLVSPTAAPARSLDAPATGTDSTYVIGAAGDIACPSDPYPDTNPDHCQYDDTADLVAPRG